MHCVLAAYHCMNMSTYISATLPVPTPAGLGFLASNVDVISTMIEHLCKQAVSEIIH